MIKVPATLLLVLSASISVWAGPMQSPAPDPMAAGARIAALVRMSRAPVSAEAVGELRRSLSAEDPSIRAAAARLVHSIGAVEALPELRQALAVEREAGPAFEQAWALADLDTTEGSNEVLLQALTRPNHEPAIVRAIVAGRGPRVVPLWGALKGAFEAQAPSVIAGLGDGLHREAGTLFASFAVRDGLVRLFDAVLSSEILQVDPALGRASLSASSPVMRTAGYLYLATLASPPPACDGCERKEPEDLTERFARHLLEAAWDQPRSETFDGLVNALATDDTAKIRLRERYRDRAQSFRGLSSGERDRVLKVLDWNEPPRIAASIPASASPIKTLGGSHPEGMPRAVLEATDCVGAAGSFSAVEAWHRPGGRLTRVTPLKSHSSEARCGEAALLLAITTLATDGDANAVTVLPERPEFLACLAESRPRPHPSSREPERVGGQIQGPRKVRNVAPVYPEGAKAAHVQGAVVIETWISESGCIQSMRVTRSAGAQLDLAAFDAVSRWAYTPTRLDGAPVPVIMTITINFRLN